MWKVYQCLAVQHDHRLVALAVLFCIFGTCTSLFIVQRGLESRAPRGRRWLLLGGIVTGVAIWTTHFIAMLAFKPGIEISFDAARTLESLVLAIVIASVGWQLAAGGGERRGTLGGAFVGMALLVAHFLDMSALRAPGTVVYDNGLITVAVTGGAGLCALSGWLVRHRCGARFSAGPPLLLASGILFLHFVAISAVRIIPDGSRLPAGLDLGLYELAEIVIAAAALILTIALGIAYHDQRLARVTARDRDLLRQSEDHYRYSVELNPQIPWISDPDGNLIEISPRWSALIGDTREGALGRGWLQSLHPDDRAGVLAIWREALEKGDGALADCRYRLLMQGGSYRWFRARARPRRDEAGRIVKWYGNLEDIHEQVRAELALTQSEERYRLASRATNDVIWDLDLESATVSWSEAVGSVLGYPEAAAGTSFAWWVDRLHPDDRGRVVANQQAILAANRDHWVNEYRFLTGDSSYRHLLSRGYIVRDEHGVALRVLGALLDITDRKRVEEKLRWAAHHDPLTGLPNRALFAERLTCAIEQCRDGGCVALIVFDVDRFKSLNDAMGHLAGDRLLREIAARIFANAPADATVARLGGDEFAVVLPALANEGAGWARVEAILRGVQVPFVLDSRTVEISLTAGTAIAPRDGDNPEALLKSADLALYAAKAEAPGSLRDFRPEMREAVERDKKMLIDARDALGENRIAPFYQPKICLRTGKLIGFEALLRWHHHGRGLQAPDAIVAAFDDGDLAVQLTDRMLDRIIADIVTWRDAGCAFGRIAFNGSALDFLRGGFADRILSRLAAAGLPSSVLELEVTETVFLGQYADRVEEALTVLSQSGVTIALDDFGTGYASLSHLKQFPVDTLKIDRSFVSRLASSDTEDGAIVGAVIDLARNLGIATVAEGVETVSQAEYLMARGCDVGQGYLFGRAIASSRIPDMIAAWDPDAVLSKCLGAGWVETLRRSHPVRAPGHSH